MSMHRALVELLFILVPIWIFRWLHARTREGGS